MLLLKSTFPSRPPTYPGHPPCIAVPRSWPWEAPRGSQGSHTTHLHTRYIQDVHVCVCLYVTWDWKNVMVMYMYMYVYIYNGFGENPIFGSLKLGCLRGVTGLQVCRLLPSQLFIWGLSQLSLLSWQKGHSRLSSCYVYQQKNALKRLNLYVC